MTARHALQVVRDAAGSGRTMSLGDDEIIFLREDLVVAMGCFEDSEVLFDAITPEWERFCRETLHFQLPDWDEESGGCGRRYGRRVGETPISRVDDTGIRPHLTIATS